MFQHEPAQPGEEEADEQFEDVILTARLAPMKGQIFQALVEDEEDGQHGAALDDDVEEVTLFATNEVFGNEQVAS